MNRRILKKLSKKAALILKQRDGIDCSPSDDGESTEAQGPGWPRRELSLWSFRSGGYVDLLPGTPLYSWRCSHEYDEWDYRPAWNELLERAGWEYAIYKKDIDPNYQMPADGGDSYPFIYPDLGTPAKVFALLKTKPPKSRFLND